MEKRSEKDKRLIIQVPIAFWPTNAMIIEGEKKTRHDNHKFLALIIHPEALHPTRTCNLDIRSGQFADNRCAVV